MTYSIPKAIDIANVTTKSRQLVIDAISRGEMYGTPKYDGCAVHIEFDKGVVTSCVSGSGKEVRSVRHLAERIALSLCGYTGAVDAEAWIPNREFQDISGEFRRHHPSENLVLRIFDGHLGDTEASWISRIRLLSEVFADYSTISVVKPTTSILDMEDAEAFARSFKSVSCGYDGAVLHWCAKPYTPGRSKWDTLKIKPLLDFDLRCTGYERATGEKTGRDTCALIVEGVNGPWKVATGLNHEEQENPGQFVGKVIRVYAMGMTKDRMPREPRFGGLSDKTVADYDEPTEE